ncbi:MAG: M56 family metallopeptidase, partial [Planctomycetaceae bacterium]|nr:M56 family metallopeptidase [Planctomycetaceae bacterium]
NRISQAAHVVAEQSTDPAENRLLSALEIAAGRLRLKSRVQLLTCSTASVPTVWGLLRYRVLLPDAALQWSDQQLLSVLLHELGHVHRRDTWSLLLTQLTIMIHWFNPLVWLTEWRLHQEREQACDDLVLSGGVRPSDYAEHLLQITTGFSGTRWTHVCGLAMARSSQLHDRLDAVLMQSRNRGVVTPLTVLITLVLGILLILPVAMMTSPVAEAGPGPVDEKSDTGAAAVSLRPETVSRLKWGETSGGLQMALAWPPALREPALGEQPDFQLLIRNVSDQPVHLVTGPEAMNPRKMLLKEDQRIVLIFSSADATEADWQINPGEIVVMPFSPPDPATQENARRGYIGIEETVRKTPTYHLQIRMTIEAAPAGAWTGTLQTGASRCSLDVIEPTDKAAQELFQIWNRFAREDGEIPGGMIGLLADSIHQFIEYNPTWKTTPQLQEFLPRLDAARDWTGQEAAELLDQLAAIQESPIKMASSEEESERMRGGMPLPGSLQQATWGVAADCGLQLAWQLDPQLSAYAQGTSVRSHILIRNSGTKTVVFRSDNWHQGAHSASDGDGTALQSTSTSWTTMPQFVPWRLNPGEYVELYATGIGIGQRPEVSDWQNARVGTWIEATVGTEVNLHTEPIPMNDANRLPRQPDPENWWPTYVRSRVKRHEPIPKEQAARELVLYRLAMDLFGTPVSQDIREAFFSDHSDNVAQNLAKRLSTWNGIMAFDGTLQSGDSRFRVEPPDPEANRRPRTVVGPGNYTLADKVRLRVRRSARGERVENEIVL